MLVIKEKPIKKVDQSNNMSNHDSFLNQKNNDLKGRSRDYKVDESDDEDAVVADSIDNSR